MFTPSRLPVFAFLFITVLSCRQEKHSGLSQTLPPPISDPPVYEYLLKPDSLLAAGNYDSAAFYYEAAATKLLAEEDLDGYYQSLIELGKVYLKTREFQKAFDALEVFHEALEKGKISKKQVADYHFVFGTAYNYLGNADSSEYHHTKALEIRKALYAAPHIEKVESLMGLGNVYCYMRQDYTQSQQYFEEALRELNSLGGPVDSEPKFLCYYNLAATYRNRKNLDKAEYYAKGSLSIAEETQNAGKLKYAYQLLAGIYESKLDYSQAVDHFNKCIEFAELDKPVDYAHLVVNYNNLAINLRKQQKLDSAITVFKQALHTIDEHRLDFSLLKVEILANIGFTYHKLGNKSPAIDFLKRSVSTGESLDEEWPKRYLPYYFLATYYKTNNKIDLAITNYKRALRYLIQSDNMAHSKITNYSATYSVLFETAHAYKKKKDIYADKLHLEDALHYYLLADSVLQVHRKTNFLESDELWLNDEIQEYYEEGLECVKELYLANPSAKLVREGFKLIDQNKARTLAKSVRKVEELAQSGVPDSLIQQSKEMKQQIALLQRKNESSWGKEEKQTIEKSLLDLIQKEGLLNSKLEKTYGASLKYRMPYDEMKIDSVQHFTRSEKSAIISYYQGKSQITTLAIGPDSSFLYFIDIDKKLLDQLTEYRKLLNNGRPTSLEEFKRFANISHRLYQQLVQPALSNSGKDIKKINIIGDRLLSLIPVETFISEFPDTSKVDYKNLDYLVKKYEISYAFSVSFMLPEQQRNSNSTASVISFAGWGYDRLDNNNTSGLPAIIQAKSELVEVSRKFKRRLYLNEEATETSFKRDAGKHDILHLSVHGTAPENDMPCIFFNKDEENDGMLYPYELYGLKLKAEMAVLSACETGAGKIHPGEGIFSMARGFFYAGCPSLILNLWNARDQSVKQVQKFFYENLVKGYSKDKSLQQSKISYLNQSDRFTAHPVFWASSVLLGSSQALGASAEWSSGDIESIRTALIIVIATILIAFLSFTYIRNRITGKLSR